MNWKNKTVFLTGASSGIGAGLAVALAKQGAVLGLLARRKELLDKLRKECEKVGGTARVFAYDVTNEDAVLAAVEEFVHEFEHIDVLIANAGIGGNNAETRAMQPLAVKKVIDINLMGAVNSVHAVLPGMLKRGSGQIVAISSLAGFRGLPRSAAYSASKAGMTAFFESVRLDVKHQGVDVTIIQPGFIKTPLTSGREARMPFIMELDDAIPLFLKAIEKKKRFAAFPWQLATAARLGAALPRLVRDRVMGAAAARR